LTFFAGEEKNAMDYTVTQTWLSKGDWWWMMMMGGEGGSGRTI